MSRGKSFLGGANDDRRSDILSNLLFLSSSFKYAYHIYVDAFPE